MALDPVTGRDPELEALFGPYGYQPAPVPAATTPAPQPMLDWGGYTPPAVVPPPISEVPVPPPALPIAAPALPEAPAPTASELIQQAIDVGPDVRTTTPVPTKGFKDARKALDTNYDAQKKTIGDETDLNKRKADTVLKDEEQFGADRKAFEQRTAEQRAALERQRQEASAAAKELREKHARDYEKPFFEEKGVAREWLSWISVGLGAFAATFNGTPNFAWQSMEKMLDAHASREKGRLQRQKDEIERAGGDVTELTQRLRDYDTITKPQQEAALLQSFTERRRLAMAKFGKDEATVAGDKLLQKVEEEKQARALQVESGLASHRVVDNSEQNKLKRQQILGTGGEKPTERQQVAATGINGALEAIKLAKAETKEFTAKDRDLLEKYVGQVREIATSDPEKFWAAYQKLGGGYYNQMSANGKKRFGLIQQAAQDMERVLSGGVINGGEMATRISLAGEPGGLRHLTNRAKSMTAGLSAQGKAQWMAEIDTVEKSFGAPASPKEQAETRAQAIQLLRTGASAKNKAALEWVRDNPGNPDAQSVLNKARGL